MLRGALILATVLALGACASPKAPDPVAQSVARGHAVAVHACSACHAVDPGGRSPRAGAAAFGSLEMRHVAGLEGRVAEITRGGHYDMPALKLTAGEVADLTAYIESLEPNER